MEILINVEFENTLYSNLAIPLVRYIIIMVVLPSRWILRCKGLKAFVIKRQQLKFQLLSIKYFIFKVHCS